MRYDTVFILSYKDLSDFDRRFSLLSPFWGKISALCKKILKPGAKLIGHLEVPNYSWVELVWTYRGWQITQALEQSSYPATRKNLLALRTVLCAAKLLDEFLPVLEEREVFKEVLLCDDFIFQNQKIFSLWGEFLHQVENSASQMADYAVDPGNAQLQTIVQKETKTQPAENNVFSFRLFYSQMILRMLDVLGFLPDLFVCAECQQELLTLGKTKGFQTEKVFYFDNQLYCLDCRQRLRLIAEPFSPKVLLAVKKALSGSWIASLDNPDEFERLAQILYRQARVFMI